MNQISRNQEPSEEEWAAIRAGERGGGGTRQAQGRHKPV